ncbi:MAG: ankyrin repeat domain-containing protein [Alphaproteobacteria bacterium]|nr:ankyrin repeat domain-containing protein [Alphaproteobacteria bacterium]
MAFLEKLINQNNIDKFRKNIKRIKTESQWLEIAEHALTSNKPEFVKELVKYLAENRHITDPQTRSQLVSNIMNQAFAQRNLDMVEIILNERQAIAVNGNLGLIEDLPIELLHTAIASRKSNLSLNLLKYFEKEDLNKCDANGSTALLSAITNGMEEVALALIKKGVQLNVTERNGHSALTVAINLGMQKAASALIEAGADIRIRDSSELNPLTNAIHRKRTNVVLSIAEHADNLSKQEAHQILRYAYLSNKRSIRPIFSKIRNINPETPPVPSSVNSLALSALQYSSDDVVIEVLMHNLEDLNTHFRALPLWLTILRAKCGILYSKYISYQNINPRPEDLAQLILHYNRLNTGENKDEVEILNHIFKRLLQQPRKENVPFSHYLFEGFFKFREDNKCGLGNFLNSELAMTFEINDCNAQGETILDLAFKHLLEDPLQSFPFYDLKVMLEKGARCNGYDLNEIVEFLFNANDGLDSKCLTIKNEIYDILLDIIQKPKVKSARVVDKISPLTNLLKNEQYCIGYDANKKEIHLFTTSKGKEALATQLIKSGLDQKLQASGVVNCLVCILPAGPDSEKFLNDLNSKIKPIAEAQEALKKVSLEELRSNRISASNASQAKQSARQL